MKLKLQIIRLLRFVLDREAFSSPKLVKFRRRLQLGELYRTDVVQYRVERTKDMGAKVGKNCRFFGLDIFSEPRLVDIGDNTIMSGKVVLLTHDGAIHSAAYNEIPDINGYYGRISIGRKYSWPEVGSPLILRSKTIPPFIESSGPDIVAAHTTPGRFLSKVIDPTS